MTETIAEMVLPGTYIEVRAEGLIGAGAIATGNIGVVGTATRGAANTVRSLGSYSDALDMFGMYGSYANGSDPPPHTLVRTLEQIFIGGGQNVFAVRIANGTPAAASAVVKGGGNSNAFTLNAVDPGSWANGIAYSVTQDDGDGGPYKVVLTGPRGKETFAGSDAAEVAGALAGSRLVTVDGKPGAGTKLKVADGKLDGGTDGGNVTSKEIQAGLAALEGWPVNIVLVAGVGSDVALASLQSHLERTQGEGRERIGIVGARSSVPAEVALDSPNDGRIVHVAPGLLVTDTNGQTVALPPSYTAALVAGRLSTLAPQTSLTNKTLPVEDLDDAKFTSTDYQTLLQKNVLLVRRKFGFQIVKGITSDTGAFKQISVRRIVDYAKAGVRAGADAYIGRLNNVRVRAAMKATLDGFLSQMVLDEMLVGYTLDVSATRAQEVNGICTVTMTLLPTFSIDYIRVTINLQ
jgi:hypothetical protein